MFLQISAVVSILSLYFVSLISQVVAQGFVPTGLIPTALDLNSGWSPLVYNITQSPWIPNLFKISSPIPFVLLYSDAFCPGKMVSIYVNGTMMIDSTTVPQQNGNCDPKINQPIGTFAFPQLFSHAVLNLPQGEHEIAVKVIQSDPKLPTGIMYIRAFIPPKFSCNAH